ncbi:hypothetical protein [Kordia sp.]|uniref:hypothetical protein n=1 Tax=Kordia sp. TaxID=1965332 RepID=UPI003D6A6B9E
MFGILNFLFGKKVKITIPNLGIFEARVKRDKQKEITWVSDENSTYRNKEVSLLLLGNSKGPYPTQIEAAKFILKDEENIKSQMVDEISKDIKLQEKFKGQKITDYRLKCIYPWNEKETPYELSFESKINDEYIGVMHTGEKIESVFF